MKLFIWILRFTQPKIFSVLFSQAEIGEALSATSLHTNTSHGSYIS
jgi:hypothetical protein